MSVQLLGTWVMVRVRVLDVPTGVGLIRLPLLWLAKWPALLPGNWNTAYSVSARLAKEFAGTHMSVEVISSTRRPAGIKPPGGSSRWPQERMLLFSCATSEAVVASCTKPLKKLFGQSTTRSFSDRGEGPVMKRTISLLPSAAPGHCAVQASTRMLSISRHLAGTWAWAVFSPAATNRAGRTRACGPERRGVVCNRGMARSTYRAGRHCVPQRSAPHQRPMLPVDQMCQQPIRHNLDTGNGRHKALSDLPTALTTPIGATPSPLLSGPPSCHSGLRAGIA